MKPKPTYANVVATLALIVALTGSAYGSLSNSAGVAASPRVWHKLNRPVTDLPDADGTRITVLKISNLPPGDYLLTANTIATDFAEEGYVRCYIFVGSQNMSGGLGSATSVGPTQGDTVAQITATAVASKGKSFSVSLQCAPDVGAPGARVEESHLWAMRVDKVVHSGDDQF